jgi:hypothetical protein
MLATRLLKTQIAMVTAEKLALLSDTTFWSFLREFLPLSRARF